MAVLMSGFMAAMYLIPGSACTLVWQELVIVVGWTLFGIFLGIRGKRLYKDLFASGMEKKKDMNRYYEDMRFFYYGGNECKINLCNKNH
jgi:hypothetical protein